MWIYKKSYIFAPDLMIKSLAQMAESVDALVSNTSRFTPVPVRPRLWVLKEKFERTSLFFVSFNDYEECVYSYDFTWK